MNSILKSYECADRSHEGTYDYAHCRCSENHGNSTLLSTFRSDQTGLQRVHQIRVADSNVPIVFELVVEFLYSISSCCSWHSWLKQSLLPRHRHSDQSQLVFARIMSAANIIDKYIKRSRHTHKINGVTVGVENKLKWNLMFTEPNS
jgi:hypothetical protein